MGADTLREDYMEMTLNMAVDNVRSGHGGPFAALIVKDGVIVGQGTNLVTSSNDPSAHAEIVAIRAACRRLETFHLRGCSLYASCEPCPMCLGAVYWARIGEVYYAATRSDAKEAGFDDEHIYEELTRAPQERSIAMARLHSEASGRPFEAWIAEERRTSY